MKTVLATAVLLATCGLAPAKLPPPDPATKAKADEAAAKTAWQAKVDTYQLCKAQDRVVAVYMKTSGKSAPKEAKPAPTAAPAASGATANGAPGAGPAGPTGGSGTPVAAKPPSPCADPGPFAYNAPEEKPLEASGAHSPAGTAASPPSVRQHSADMVPGKKP